MAYSSWRDISISKFIEIYTISTKVKDTLDQEIKLLACLKDVPESAIEAYTISELTKESAKLGWLKEMPEGKIHTTFRHKGQVYRACLFFDDMKANQFIDFSSICKDVKPEDTIFHMADLIACMVQKRKYQFKYPFVKYEYVGYSNTDFKDMPMSQAYPYYVFFCKVLTALHPAILNSSIQKANKHLKKVKTILKKT